YHAGSTPAAPTKIPNYPTRTAMSTVPDTPARPKSETAAGKTPAALIRSLHDKALKSLARRMAGYTQKEIKTIYEYDPDGARRIKSETITRKQVGPDLAAITFALTNLDPQHWRAAGNRRRRPSGRLERLERRGPARNRRDGGSLSSAPFGCRNRRHYTQPHPRPNRHGGRRRSPLPVSQDP
ncbi:MAG: hypothetical protein ACLR76_10515, partial [Alistipes sp.]